MPFEPVLEAGEVVAFVESFRPGPKAAPFAFAVSDRAVYLPAKKAFAVSDPWYFRRVPRHDVHSVARQRLRPAGLIVLGVVLVVLGAAVSYLMLEPIVAGRGGKVSGYPFGIVAVGLVLPFVARGRFALVVSLTSGSFKWKPPITIGGPVKAQSQDLISRILRACRDVGIPTHDEQSGV